MVDVYTSSNTGDDDELDQWQSIELLRKGQRYAPHNGDWCIASPMKKWSAIAWQQPFTRVGYLFLCSIRAPLHLSFFTFHVEEIYLAWTSSTSVFSQKFPTDEVPKKDPHTQASTFPRGGFDETTLCIPANL